ncbi:methylmalonyl Co-A mutase-associated GTPase MeaB [Puniceicoccales bacterium CK1056]|uniref:Methylmalonyl Co-A mutase-associated GTPase MeaB n=1 Tax=Oceanipulchritudo coccoides TaxID=2706888 RepID=A0A6B2M3Z4_9BACT|nr:methylmalonyl Co-A mutase-associated GTPase MeaB [Oceanipulchritudo coccoides]NDV62824.1 methylmalonyl Co-A mutase-associated GTPase MeaB [Oceanipulchritudo coccoides]
MTESDERKRPEWAPAEGGEGFASNVMKGVEGGHDGMPGSLPSISSKPPAKRRQLSVDELEIGIRSGDRTLLARAITLVESNAPAHQALAQELLDRLMPETGKSLRVGITGVPGAGKSTMIDTLGAMLCEKGFKVAVLAVDPSSSVTKGSILGDKTRMEKLLGHKSAFVRPSPTGGCLGGVARKTRETLLLCEAFGFDVILLETVGVGQSEVTVRSMVDFFLLVMISGAGDELQGIKKGVIELADAIVVNKADGDNVRKARMAKAEYNRVLSFLHPCTEGWKTKAYMASALTKEGIPELWEKIQLFKETVQANGVFEKRRQTQNLDWMHELLNEALRQRFLANTVMHGRLQDLSAAVARGEVPPVKAVEDLIEHWVRLDR